METKKIFDLGDVALPHANNNERCIKILQIFTRELQRKKPVVSIGGDHSITGGILQGLGSNNLELTKWKNIISSY